MKEVIGQILILVLLLFYLPNASASIITPQKTPLQEFENTQEVIITVINNEFSPEKINLELHLNSMYLKNYVQIEPKEFVLNPNEQKNVKIKLNIPNDLTPQTHIIQIENAQNPQTKAQIEFKKEGKMNPNLIIKNASIAIEEETMFITLEMRNSGNVHIYAKPLINILNQTEKVKDINYPQPIQILSSDEYTLILRQDISELKENNYSVTVKTQYTVDDLQKETEEEIIYFKIQGKNQTDKAVKTFNISYIIPPIVMLILLVFIWKRNPRETIQIKKSNKQASLKKLKKDVHNMRKEINTIAKEATNLCAKLDKQRKEGNNEFNQ